MSDYIAKTSKDYSKVNYKHTQVYIGDTPEHRSKSERLSAVPREAITTNIISRSKAIIKYSIATRRFDNSNMMPEGSSRMLHLLKRKCDWPSWTSSPVVKKLQNA